MTAADAVTVDLWATTATIAVAVAGLLPLLRTSNVVRADRTATLLARPLYPPAWQGGERGCTVEGGSSHTHTCNRADRLGSLSTVGCSPVASWKSVEPPRYSVHMFSGAPSAGPQSPSLAYRVLELE